VQYTFSVVLFFWEGYILLKMRGKGEYDELFTLRRLLVGEMSFIFVVPEIAEVES
jgi:hypothetical protein